MEKTNTKYFSYGTIAVLAIFTTATIAFSQQQAQAADGGNFFSDVGQAISDGRQAGEYDAENGNSRSANCSGGIAYCIAFNDGYYDAYDAEMMVGGD